MKLTRWAIFLWSGGFVSQVLVALVLLLRDRIREFPCFSLWVVASITYTCAAYPLLYHTSHSTFLATYYGYSVIDQCLQLLLAFEIARHVFAPAGKWTPDIRRTITGVAVIAAIVAFAFSLSAQPATDWYASLVLRSNFFNATLMSELFVGMVVLSETTGLPWKTHTARIAQGLGGYSLMCVALGIGKIFYGHEHGTHNYDELNHIRGLGNIACCLFWAVALWIKAPASAELPEALKIQIYTLNRRVENDLIRIRSWSKH
jgi:hypothetical protein